MPTIVKRVFNGYSFVIGITLMLYFLAMDLLGYSDIIELRLLNAVILGAGLWIALRKHTDRDDATYFNSLWRGVEISVGSSFIFALLFWLYLIYGNTEFFPHLKSIGAFPGDFEKYHASVVIVVEGLASGAIISFMWMQYFRSKIPRDR